MSNKLIGKTIIEMKIADDKQAILFKTTYEDIIARADGDCCSSTWIDSIELPALGFPAIVISAEDVGSDTPDSSDGETKHYGFKIVTDRGEIVIEYRNESNGYYGGNLSWPDYGYYYGGVYGQNQSTYNWVDIVT